MPGSADPLQAEPILSVRGLSVSFGGLRAVENLSFDVTERQIASVIGPNGAGKTTFLNAVSGLVRASGSIRYRNSDLLNRPSHERAALGIGRTFQNGQLFGSMTLLDNVLTARHTRLSGNPLLDMLRIPVVSRERQAKAYCRDILRLLDIERFAERAADSLPFGVQKLAGLARALAPEPEVLLLDEPAAGLNRREAAALGKLVIRLRDEMGMTCLLVEHNMRLVMAISDKVIVLDHGRKLGEGTSGEIRNNPAVIEAYLGGADPGVKEEVTNELARGT